MNVDPAISPLLSPRDEYILPLEAPSSARWYAIYSRCHHEFTIWSQLQKKSIENFFPRLTRWSRRRDRKVKIEVPLFPGYLFVRMDYSPWCALEVLKISGVVRFLGKSNHNPTAIPDFQIESLMTIVNSVEQIMPFNYLRIGQRVRVRWGPLAGCEGILLQMKPGKDRLVITLDILHRSVAVEIDAGDVIPV